MDIPYFLTNWALLYVSSLKPGCPLYVRIACRASSIRGRFRVLNIIDATPDLGSVLVQRHTCIMSSWSQVIRMWSKTFCTIAAGGKSHGAFAWLSCLCTKRNSIRCSFTYSGRPSGFLKSKGTMSSEGGGRRSSYVVCYFRFFPYAFGNGGVTRHSPVENILHLIFTEDTLPCANSNRS